jgi:hypothetical protein
MGFRLVTLRQEMTMTLPWIAKPLNMGETGSLANLLRDAEREHSFDNIPITIFGWLESH